MATFRDLAAAGLVMADSATAVLAAKAASAGCLDLEFRTPDTSSDSGAESKSLQFSGYWRVNLANNPIFPFLQRIT